MLPLKCMPLKCICFFVTLFYCDCEQNEHENVDGDFFAVLNTSTFVDNTLFIQEFFKQNEVVHICAPGGFGKSINMDMLRRFVEIKVDENGTALQINLTRNYVRFTSRHVIHTYNIFLQIYRQSSRDFFDEHFGKYPVLYFDFKSLNVYDYPRFILSFVYMMEGQFRKYKYLLNSTSICDSDKEMFDVYLTKMVDAFKQATDPTEKENLENELTVCVEFLSFMIYTHFKQKCIILIDHCDYPFLENIFNSRKDLADMVNFLQMFWQCIFVVNKFYISGLVNSRISFQIDEVVKYYAFHDSHRFKRFYGLSHRQILQVTSAIDVVSSVSLIESWYGGYKRRGKSRACNVHCVMQYLHSLHFSSYFIESDEYTGVIRACLRKKSRIKLRSLLVNGSILVNLTPKTAVNIVSLYNEVHLRRDVNTAGVPLDLFLSLLFDFGYLTALNKVVIYDRIFYNCTIPNIEIRKEMEASVNLNNETVTEVIRLVDY